MLIPPCCSEETIALPDETVLALLRKAAETTAG
jgi:hypothetical protein